MGAKYYCSKCQDPLSPTIADYIVGHLECGCREVKHFTDFDKHMAVEALEERIEAVEAKLDEIAERALTSSARS